MDDDVKAAVEWFRRLTFEGRDYLPLLLLAHIDGEPARTAAAVAAAREEQREVHAQLAFQKLCGDPSCTTSLCEGKELRDAIRVPFGPHPTPLADRIAELEKEQEYAVAQVVKAEAERGEAKEALDEFNTRRDGAPATLAEGIHAMRVRLVEYRLEANALEAERDALRADLARVSEEMGLPPAIGPAPGELRRLLGDAATLRAQVEAARAEAEKVLHTDALATSAYDAAHDVLAAMDGAKP